VKREAADGKPTAGGRRQRAEGRGAEGLGSGGAGEIGRGGTGRVKSRRQRAEGRGRKEEHFRLQIEDCRLGRAEGRWQNAEGSETIADLGLKIAEWRPEKKREGSKQRAEGGGRKEEHFRLQIDDCRLWNTRKQ